MTKMVDATLRVDVIHKGQSLSAGETISVPSERVPSMVRTGLIEQPAPEPEPAPEPVKKSTPRKRRAKKVAEAVQSEQAEAPSSSEESAEED